ncbi:hypothetical protein CLAIMM_14598 [Cladophialophora immunda]|nr:hypothetical protein CLAIMM_14598 [Cladophialophora immunda]
MSGPYLHLPPTFFDAIVPGYSSLAQYLLGTIDISFYVSIGAFCFLLWTGIRTTVVPLCAAIILLCSSTVVVFDHEDIYDQVLYWLEVDNRMQGLRSVRVTSKGAHYGYENDKYQDDDHADTIFNFSAWMARAPPRYQPDSSTGLFLHNRHFFRITRGIQSIPGSRGHTKEELKIHVLWWSTAPLKSLIEEIREFYMSKRSTYTHISRPMREVDQQRTLLWVLLAVRPSRPISTVVLDYEPKKRILSDMNHFLHPSTTRRYANLGIPYRRGYLFWGPPGTGKTSMSFALAGVFGLPIYSVSLSEITLTEEELIYLLTTLPYRCIVLLEDIDSAGASHSRIDSKDTSKKAGPEDVSGKANSISISGLLNAIDGVTSAEGRMLIMTTNHREKLDAALLRPGRVDVQVEFNLASKKQIRQLFLRMYSTDERNTPRHPTTLSEILAELNTCDLDGQHVESGHSESENSVQEQRSSEKTAPAQSASAHSDSMAHSIGALADKFTDALPSGMYSAAELQGFLLTCGDDPLKAVKGISEWKSQQVDRKDAQKDADTAEAP